MMNGEWLVDQVMNDDFCKSVYEWWSNGEQMVGL